jgi:hypothetical protein
MRILSLLLGRDTKCNSERVALARSTAASTARDAYLEPSAAQGVFLGSAQSIINQAL